jgi:protein N-terminal amidase
MSLIPQAEGHKMKIACLQFAPELYEVQRNIQKADSILSSTQIPKDIDWIVLPELAFAGYNFQSLDEIRPYLEPTASGISTTWAKQKAQHYNCHVTVGYAEQTPVTQFNSTVTVSPTGEVLCNYRKSFLYYTDETWASEGPRDTAHNLSNPASDDLPFFAGQLGTLGAVTLGICMDINSYRFIAPWTDFEFACRALTSSTPLICVSMAWLTNLSPEELFDKPDAPDVATISYWLERFAPIVESRSDTPVYVVLANRCGMEKTVCYAGSTTVMKIHQGVVSLFETCGKGEERCLVVDLSERPKFQVRSGT